MNGLGHITIMAATPIYGKNLQNQKPGDIETWQEGLMTGALLSLYK